MHPFPTIAEAARRIHDRTLEPLALVERCLAHIGRCEPEVCAWVRVDECGARREAEELGRLLRAGVDLGPLHGIPLGIKDIVDVRGLPTEAGSPLLRGCTADCDAPVVARLRAAGAIILGKTVTTPFAFIDPPPTRNPWNTAHTPGGSSSGSAAAVACGMCLGAVGSQTAGSIIRPAAFCGVAGWKPTFGRVETAGVIPLSPHLDHVGALARSADDLAILQRAMSTAAGPVREHAFAESPPAFWVIDEFFMAEAEAAVRQVTQAAYDGLRAAGAALRPLSLPPSLAPVAAAQRTIMAVDAAVVHRETFTHHAAEYPPQIRALIEQGTATPAIEYATALQRQQRFRRDMEALLDDDRVALTPATTTAAPAGYATTGDPRFQLPWSHAGLPAVTIPCGLTPAGLPCGLQLVGGRDQDEPLLAVAGWCERVLGFDARPAIGC
jgi:Asp-tRNA(Asn)/Glu-tRNA(Gln) amidotransferase A subunit family amidase